MGSTAGDCKYNVNSIICSYDEETLRLPSCRGNDSSVLATLPETFESLRSKVTDISTLMVHINVGSKESFNCYYDTVIFFFVLQTKKRIVTYNSEAEGCSFEDITNPCTPPLLPGFTSSFLRATTDGCDLNVKAATERTNDTNGILDKKTNFCLGVNTEHSGFTAFLCDYNCDVGQCVPCRLVQLFRDAKENRFSLKM